jgi:hypothetical protein
VLGGILAFGVPRFGPWLGGALVLAGLGLKVWALRRA